VNYIVAMILGKGKGDVARCRLKEAGAKSTSRRTEMSYKAKRAGEFALQNETQDPVSMVNDAVVWRQFTFLSGEICSTCGRPGSAGGGNIVGDRTEVSRGRSSSSGNEGPNSGDGLCPRKLSGRDEPVRGSGR